MTNLSDREQLKNTDKEIWRQDKDDDYSPSIFVTEQNGIGINIGGHVIVKPIQEWFSLDRLKEENGLLAKRMIELSNENTCLKSDLAARDARVKELEDKLNSEVRIVYTRDNKLSADSEVSFDDIVKTIQDTLWNPALLQRQSGNVDVFDWMIDHTDEIATAIYALIERKGK